MWRRRPTGAPWRMATPSSAARMVLPVLAVCPAANTLWHAVTVQLYCTATAHQGPEDVVLLRLGHCQAIAGLLYGCLVGCGHVSSVAALPGCRKVCDIAT